MEPITISTAYFKMKNLCVNLGNEIQADIKINNQHILPRYVSTMHIKLAFESHHNLCFPKFPTKNTHSDILGSPHTFIRKLQLLTMQIWTCIWFTFTIIYKFIDSVPQSHNCLLFPNKILTMKINSNFTVSFSFPFCISNIYHFVHNDFKFCNKNLCIFQ